MSSGTDARRFADAYSPSFGLNWMPVLPREQLASMSDTQLVEYMQARKQADEWAAKNPVGSGWVLPSWRNVMKHWKSHRVHVILGGHRSSKSILAARLCVWALGTIPEAEVRCFHVNKKRSKEDQQRWIWEAMPESLKRLPTTRGKYHTVQWTQANGFTNDTLILPPLGGWTKGGRIDFSNYASYMDDQQTAEGFKAHLIHLDEEAPLALYKTLLSRLNDYRGRMILSFTTIQGWSPLVQELLGKVRTLETRYAPLVKKKVPVLQESLSQEGVMIHYFWTEDNPFIPLDNFLATMRGSPEDEVLARAYGIPTKAAKAVFTKFSRDSNVVKHEDLPFVKDPNYPVTRYMAIDPGGSKNWFMLWVAVDAAGTWWVYREWPDFETYGAWAEAGPTIQGKAGPAQNSLGFGIKDYVELIRTLENGEPIFERMIDPRMGAAEKQSADEGATTIISDLDKHDMTVIPAPGVDIDNGIQGLKDLLAWNSDKPRDSLNSPKYFVSDRCENHIHCMSEYTAKAGPEEAAKDGVDCFDSETEIYTNEGWVRFIDLKQGVPVATLSSDGHIEFEVPTGYVARQYRGEMVTCETRSVNFAVTPNHRMLVYPQGKKIKVRLAKDLCRQDTIPISSLGIRPEQNKPIELWPGKFVENEDWGEFLGWYTSEGSATGTNGGTIQLPGRGYSVYISQSMKANPEKCAKIEALLNRLGLHFHKTGGSGYAISAKPLWELLFPMGNQHDRHIPRRWLETLSRHGLERLWGALVLGDGWVQGTKQNYASVSWQLICDAQEVLTRLGRAYGVVSVRMPGSNGFVGERKIVGTVPLYSFAARIGSSASITNNSKEMLAVARPYDGMVYCVTVPNGTLLVRRNRLPMFAGNCARYLKVSNIEYVAPDDLRGTGTTGGY